MAEIVYVMLACAGSSKKEAPKAVSTSKQQQPPAIGDSSGMTSALETTVVNILDHVSLITSSGTIGLISLIVISSLSLACLYLIWWRQRPRSTCCPLVSGTGEPVQPPLVSTLTQQPNHFSTPSSRQGWMTSATPFLGPELYRRSLEAPQTTTEVPTSVISWRPDEDFVTSQPRSTRRPNHLHFAGPTRRQRQQQVQAQNQTRKVTRTINLEPSRLRQAVGPTVNGPRLSDDEEDSNVTADAEDYEDEVPELPTPRQYSVPAIEY